MKKVLKSDFNAVLIWKMNNIATLSLKQIKVEFSNPMNNDEFEELMIKIPWQIINEPPNAFSAFATIESHEPRRLRCTLDLTSLNDSLKIE